MKLTMERLIYYYDLHRQYFEEVGEHADELIKNTFGEGFTCVHCHNGKISIYLDGMYRFTINLYDRSVIKDVYSIDSTKVDMWTEEDYENTKNKLLELFKGGA
ncbi:MAG: hypothetical protein AB7D38_12075 [Sulfurimonas sp.]|uniref:hypothetical protein n=1 Tax=Sulfurimonas sp. TaxID=2022749 RepID=UPI003D0ACCA6